VEEGQTSTLNFDVGNTDTAQKQFMAGIGLLLFEITIFCAYLQFQTQIHNSIKAELHPKYNLEAN
jgi:hypothetical protein